MDYVLSFRSRGAIAAFWFSVIGVAIFLVVVATSDGVGELRRAVPIGLVVLTWAWWRWAWPAFFVEVSSASISEPTGITIRNQIKSVKIPWSAVSGFSSRLGLYVAAETPAGVAKNYFVAAVPSKAGIGRSPQVADEPLPLLHPKGGKQTIWENPSVVRRLLENEHYYRDSPNDRPPLPAAATSVPTQPGGRSDFPEQVTVTYNWVPILFQAATLIFAVFALLTW